MGEVEGLPKAEFAFPGPLRDRLITAILDGRKTATASLVIEYEPIGPEPMPAVGLRALVVDSDDRPVALIETTDVCVLRFDEVGVEFAPDEGEGFESVADWRRGHIDFWGSDQFRIAIGRPEFCIADDTLVVAERFRLVETLEC